MKKKFREMHAQMQDRADTQQGFERPEAERPVPKKTGDYIDFEEIK